MFIVLNVKRPIYLVTLQMSVLFHAFWNTISGVFGPEMSAGAKNATCRELKTQAGTRHWVFVSSGSISLYLRSGICEAS